MRPRRTNTRRPRVNYQSSARRSLRRFRQGSMLAVAMAAFLLMLFPGAAAQEALEAEPAPPETSATAAAADPEADLPRADDAAEGLEQATGTIQQLLLEFYGLLPKILIAIIIIALAVLLARIVRSLLKRSLRSWRRAEAVSALVGIAIVIVALGVALSVISGDATALVGSVGLVGLALSWALQAPIESFTGWLLNSFRDYYRVGDRISVGEVFGDVYRIDLLSTTVWEAGGPDKPVQGAQPTGSLATFPNAEILRSTIVNHTRHFPYVWDEVTFGFANESDLAYVKEVLERLAAAILAPARPERMKDYHSILTRRGLVHEIDPEPKVYFSQADAWTNATIRYLVPARERRKWASELILAASRETARPEHKNRIIPGYPRTQVQVLEP